MSMIMIKQPNPLKKNYRKIKLKNVKKNEKNYFSFSKTDFSKYIYIYQLLLILTK